MNQKNKKENLCLQLRFKKNKSGQIAIFVIVALILIVGIALIFVLVNKPTTKINMVENPGGFIEKCISDSVIDAVNQINIHGGYINPEEPYLLYEKEKVAYLCYTAENEKLCVSKEPMLIERAEEEIKNYILPEVNGCFESLKQSLKDYEYKEENLNLNIEIKPKQVLAEINKKISFIKQGQTQNYNAFDISISSPLYNFVKITNDIINEEIDCNCGKETCNADVFNVAQSHDFEVERFVTGKNEKAYTIREVISGNEFKFAVRNCVRLPW